MIEEHKREKTQMQQNDAQYEQMIKDREAAM